MNDIDRIEMLEKKIAELEKTVQPIETGALIEKVQKAAPVYLDVKEGSLLHDIISLINHAYKEILEERH